MSTTQAFLEQMMNPRPLPPAVGPRAYFIYDVREIRDPERMDQYRRVALPMVARYGGRYVVVGGPVAALEGSWYPSFPVIIEFPTLEHAERWYHSPEYRELRNLRSDAARIDGVILQGI
jgi:uncharacterized protein (DUF1330 family)